MRVQREVLSLAGGETEGDSVPLKSSPASVATLDGRLVALAPA